MKRKDSNGTLIFRDKMKWREIWREYYRDFLLYDFLMAPLGILFAIVYYTSPLAVILFVLPSLLAYVGVGYQEKFKTKKEEAIKDELTGLYNRRFFNEQLELGFFQAQREGKNLSLIILDLDNFKKFNDTYGHPEGDLALKEVGEMMQRIKLLSLKKPMKHYTKLKRVAETL